MSSKSRKKVLLMGKSGSGKTSMRSIIFRNQLAADTRRLGATIDVESSQIKFLGGLRLDLWDCGGQDSFMDSHLTSQSSTIFRSVHSLIYIFDAESPDLTSSDTHYFLKCLGALRDQNPINSDTVVESAGGADPAEGEEAEGQGPTVFILLHKMDLVPEAQQSSKLAEFEADVTKRATESGWKGNLKFYGTSIWNETLYKAWSIVIAHLMPSLSSLRSHLSHFLELSSASEVVLFERTTFLVISSVTAPSEAEDAEDWDKRRFERISTMVKAFKLGCTRIRSPFSSLTLSSPNYTAVLDTLTPETYILVLARNTIQPAAIELNIRLARPHFGKLEAIGMSK
ncbi:Gtr1/RagA G protein conserved region-domain-containing protein [Leucosporidium creatinivorum]|uniref:GTP-binding protein n=1 Tax=Leucosporidium creatinivorum TaxID=106004 RepID=A0A1Y2EUX5_9BASI|nr:Gtr1/RagA G protein conserved region-domain-containing protein [Leucosporidium creatinivorum]